MGTAAVVLAAAGPAQGAGSAQPIRKLATVNLRAAADQAQRAPYRPALRNMPAIQTFAALDARRHRDEADQLGAAAVLKPPTVKGLPVTINEAQRGFEG